MRPITLPLAAWVLASCGAPPQTTITDETDERAVIERSRAWIEEGWSPGGDTASFSYEDLAPYYDPTPDALVLHDTNDPEMRILHDARAYAAAFTPFVRQQAFLDNEWTGLEHVRVEGDMAMIAFTADAIFRGEDGAEVRVPHFYSLGWRRDEGGTWRLFHEHGSSLETETASAGAAQAASCPATAPSEVALARIAGGLADLGTTSVEAAFLPDGPLGAVSGDRLADAASLRPRLEDGRAWAAGDLLWWAGSVADGRRLTVVWEAGNEALRPLHAHLSEPVALGSRLVPLPALAEPGASGAVAARVGSFWGAWTRGDLAAARDHYVPRDDTLVFLPWVPEAFEGRDAFFEAARGVLDANARTAFLQAGPASVIPTPGAALATGLFEADVLSREGEATTGGGRYTLLFVDCGGTWRVQHEHLSSYQAEDAQ